jgi:predicted metal-dependent HD superfamily phosphohydrolase
VPEVTSDDERLIAEAVTAAGLNARYDQPHRKYHTRTHVENVLHQIDTLDPPPSSLVAVRLAAWFHDAIYAPGRDDNEHRSAHLAQDTLEVVGGSPELRDEVARLIELTTTHEPAENDTSGAILCDADLSILGSDPSQYAAYARWIREEYALIPDDLFQPGRAAILRSFLERPTLFHTAVGRKRWEQTARRNLAEEIAGLEAGTTS